MFIIPLGEFTLIVGLLTGSGIVVLRAQSQYGILRVVVAAWYWLRQAVGYVAAICGAFFQIICYQRQL